jgi:hypothetical protein
MIAASGGSISEHGGGWFKSCFRRAGNTHGGHADKIFRAWASSPLDTKALPVTNDEILYELRQIHASLDRLSEDVAALGSRGRLTAEERAILSALYVAAAPVFGGKVFAAVDIIEWKTLASIVAGRSASELSWLFGRAGRVTLAGFRMERVGTDASGALWRLAVVPSRASRLHQPAPSCSDKSLRDSRERTR